MPRSTTAPLTLEVLSVRCIGLAPANYTVEVATDGIRMRKNGTSRWIGPASWESILSACQRESVRQTASESPLREMAVRS